MPDYRQPVTEKEGSRLLDLLGSVSVRWHQWRSRRRVLKGQRLLDGAGGARMLGANLTSLEESEE